MKEPKGTERFLIDVQHGTTYHDIGGCFATTYSQDNYIETSYADIKKLVSRKGVPFEPHGCVLRAKMPELFREGGEPSGV